MTSKLAADFLLDPSVLDEKKERLLEALSQKGETPAEIAGFVEALCAGESRSSFSAKFALTLDNYPGFETLLQRL